MNNVAVGNDGFQIDGEQGYAENDVRSIDLREIWAAIYRSRFWIGGIVGGCLVAAIVLTLLATRLYDGSASVEVRQEAEKVLGTEADRESNASKIDSDRFLQTQLDIVRSRAVANTVAETLGLYNSDKFIKQMNVTEEPRGLGTLSHREAEREQVIEALLDNLSVNFTGDTRIVVISFSSPDARLSAQIANAYAESFIRNNLARKSDSSSYALEFLRDQLSEAQARLEKSEQAAIDYATRTRIVDTSNAARGDEKKNDAQSLTTSQLIQLNEAYSEAVANRISAEQKWRRTSTLALLSIPEVLTNQAVQGILEQRAQVEAEYREQLTTRMNDYPTVRQAASRIKELNNQINGIAGDIRSSIRSQYEVALSQEREFENRLDRLKSTTLVEQNQSIDLSILRRGADTNRQQYESLLKRYNELNAEAGIQTNNLSIVDRAQVPIRSAWPKWPLNIALAFLAGLILSAIFIIAREQLFDVVRSADDVKSRLGVALLGGIPSTENLVEAMRDSKTGISEAFSSVRTNLALSSDHGVPKTIMFTSTQASEGKSSACYALAMSLSRLNKRVLIIDIDLRRPNAHRMFDLPNKHGVSNILAGQMDIGQSISATDNKLIDVLTAGDIPPNPTELIMGQQLPAMLSVLSGEYDILLIDSAPVLGLADAVILSSQVEATIFVIEAGRTSIKGAQSALARIAAGGGHLVGVILSKFDPGSLGYGYGHDYTYQYEYGKKRG